MQITPRILITLFIAFLLTACPSNDGKNVNSGASNQTVNSNTNSSANLNIKDDVDELGTIIKLPIQPEEAVWREENQAKDTNDNSVSPAPTDKKLVVVLRFSKEDAAKIVAQAEKYKPADREVINNENWFPSELTAQSQLSGDETLKGTTYAANDFLQTPYSDGKLTRIDETNYFVLELFAK